jgi:hypothetical protein
MGPSSIGSVLDRSLQAVDNTIQDGVVGQRLAEDHRTFEPRQNEKCCRPSFDFRHMRRAHGRYEPSEILFEEDARVPTNILRQSAYLGAQHCAQAQFAIANERTPESIGVMRHCVFRSAVKAARLAEILNKTFGVAFGNGNADIGLGWEITVTVAMRSAPCSADEMPLNSERTASS